MTIYYLIFLLKNIIINYILFRDKYYINQTYLRDYSFKYALEEGIFYFRVAIYFASDFICSSFKDATCPFIRPFITLP